MELAEVHHEITRRFEAGPGRPPEVTDPSASKRARWIGGAGRLAVRGGADAMVQGGPPFHPRSRAGGRIPRPERVGGVESPGDGTSRARARRSRRPTIGPRPRHLRGRGCRASRAAGARDPGAALGIEPSQRLVGGVDFGHPARRSSSRRSVAGRQIGVVLAGELPPGRPDGGEGRVAGDAEYVMRISSNHASSVSAAIDSQPREAAQRRRSRSPRAGA
jgi:hypothetical protein